MSKIYITYWRTKIKKFNVEVRLFEIKYLKTKIKTQNLEIYMEFSLKIGLLSLFFFSFLCKVIVRRKWKLRNMTEPTSLPWLVDSQLLDHQGSPFYTNLKTKTEVIPKHCFPFLNFIDIIYILQCIDLKCIYCQMITTVSLVDTHRKHSFEWLQSTPQVWM